MARGMDLPDGEGDKGPGGGVTGDTWTLDSFLFASRMMLISVFTQGNWNVPYLR